MQIPSGAEVTDFMTGEYSEIPFTPDQYDKIRKWLLENAETRVTSRYARYLIIGSITSLLVVVIGLLLYRQKKARA